MDNVMTFEEEFQELFRQRINNNDVKIVEVSENYFSKLAEEFPIYGSKIDWDKVPDSNIEYNPYINRVASLCNFFRKVIKEQKLSGNIVYINDSAFDCAYIFPLDTVVSHISDILEFPEHHYFVNEDFTWCFSFTMEGEMAFGFKPIKTV
jgi:hypothetical protein